MRRRIAHDMYHASLQQFRLGEGLSRALRDLLECCGQEGVPVAFVLLPEATDFRKWYSPQGLADAHCLLAELRDAHGVTVIDATDWVADEDFIDGHHVHRRGARVFT